MSKNSIAEKKHGIAMMVVLGVIVLVTIFGFVALAIAEKDNAVAGNLVDIKSQRMTAIAGLNLAVAKMSKDPQRCASQLLAFKNDPTKAWIDLSSASSTFSVQATESWLNLGSASDQSACKVKILGIGDAQIDNALPIHFLSIGKGRNGDEFQIKGTYLIRGMDYVMKYPTSGPTDGLLARGGLENVDAGLTVDAGIYSGGTGVTKIQSSNGAACNYTRVRTRGDLEVYSDLTVTGNSIVGGKLKVENGKTATFGGNLLVGYNSTLASANRGFTASGTGNLAVKKSLYVWGTSWASPLNINLDIGGNFWVVDANAFINGSVNVGTSASDGNSWFDHGLSTKANSYIFNGRVDIGSGSTDHSLEGWIYVKRDLNAWDNGTYSHLSTTSGSLYVNGNLATTGSIITDNNTPSTAIPSILPWTKVSYAPSVIVNGKSYLGNGIKKIDRNADTSGGIVFKDRVYSYRSSQEQFANGHAEFWKPVRLNGSLSSSSFGSATGKKWAFATASASADRTWIYTGSGFDNAITNGSGTSATSDNMPARTSIVPARIDPPAVSTLGFATDELNLSLDDNPATEVRTDKLYGKLVKADLDYNEVFKKYQSACNITDKKSGTLVPPTATELKCIYDKEVLNNGPLLWNKNYLVIRITDGNRFNNLGQLSEVERHLFSGTKIFWIIECGLDVNSNWYSGAKGSIQIIEATGKLNQFGWSGDFYGFIRMSGDYNYIKAGGASFNLYGAIEVSDATKTQGFRVNRDAGGAGLNIYRNDSYVTSTMFSDIAGNFFSSDGVGTGTDAWVIRFNGDRNKTNITKEMTLDVRDGWVQFERLGEFR